MTGPLVSPTSFPACRLWMDRELHRGGPLRCVTAATACTTHGWHAYHAIVPEFAVLALLQLGAMPVEADTLTLQAADQAELHAKLVPWVSGIHLGGGRDGRN